MATLAINLGMQALGTLGALWGQHTLRLKDATNENTAAAQAVQAYDADLAQLVQGVNSGAISKGDALSALGAIDHQIMAYLQAQVGKPGTSWSQPAPGAANGGCNKQCTVGCCIYYDDLHPGILGLQQAISYGSGSVSIPQVNGSKYGLQTRAGYTLVVKVTAAVDFSSPSGAVSSIGSAFSTTVKSLEGDIFGGTTSSNTVGGAPSLLKPFLLIAGVFLAILVVFRLVR